MSKEKPTVKQCKHCKSEIPYDAKVCPVCRKKQGAPGCLIVVLVVVVLVVIAALAGGGESNTPQKVESTSGTSQAASQSSEAQPEQTVFTVGDTVELTVLRSSGGITSTTVYQKDCTEVKVSVTFEEFNPNTQN